MPPDPLLSLKGKGLIGMSIGADFVPSELPSAAVLPPQADKAKTQLMVQACKNAFIKCLQNR